MMKAVTWLDGLIGEEISRGIPPQSIFVGQYAASGIAAVILGSSNHVSQDMLMHS